MKEWKVLEPGAACLDSLGIGREGNSAAREFSIIEDAFGDKVFHVARGLTRADAEEIVRKHNEEQA